MRELELSYTGQMVRVLKDTSLLQPKNYDASTKWDKYFHNLCQTVASQGKCLSRKIGVVITRANRILATGYNGPAEGVPHCGERRLSVDNYLVEALSGMKALENSSTMSVCPRRLLNIPSGDSRFCPAVHAEMNAIITAARMGVALEGATLWMNSVISCKNCFSSMINAGIIELVVERKEFYDQETIFIANSSKIRIREFQL